MQMTARKMLVVLAAFALLGVEVARGETTNTWVGGSSTAWTTGGNWSEGVIPTNAHHVVIDVVYGGSTTNHPTLDLGGGAITIKSLTIGTNTASTLTFSNGNPDNRLIVSSNVTIGANGTLTHTANSTTALGAVHRLFLDVGGNLTVNNGGKITASSKGYAAGQGPAGIGYWCGAAHGGEGGNNAKNPYGSILSPVNIGSGGANSVGGGAVRLSVSNNIVLNGEILANGGAGNGGGAAGGSIFVSAADLSGGGVLRANGGSGVQWGGGGGGGRISLILDTGGAVTQSAYGGSSSHSQVGAAGTIHIKLLAQSHGTLLIDNAGQDLDRRTRISTDTTDAIAGDVIVRNNGALAIDADQSLSVYGSWSNATANAVTGSGRVVLTGTNTATLHGSTSFVNLSVTNAGKTVRFEAGETQTITAGFAFSGAEGDLLTLESTSEDSPWYLNQAVVHNVQYVKVSDSNATGGDPVLALNSSNVANNVHWIFAELGDIAWTGNAGNSIWTDTDNWSLGRAPLQDDPSITIPTSASGNPQPALDIDREFNGRLTIESGATLTLNGRTLTINGAVTNAGTMTATGTETLTCRGDVDFTGGTFNRAQSTLVLDGATAQTFKPDGNTFYNINIPNTNLVTVTDNFTVRDLVFLGNDTLAVFSGAVTATNITCTSKTATNTFSGGVTADAFHSLNTGGGLLTFGSGTDSNIRVLALRGGSGTPLVLRSSTPGAAWNLNVTDGSSVRFVDVQDSDASGGITVYALDSTGAAANNTNWDFGSGKVWVGTTTLWATGANWSPEGTPGATSYVLIDGFGSAQPTLNLSGGATGVLHLVVGVSSPATLTFSNGDVTDKKLVVTSNVVIGVKGTLTHTANSTTVAGAVHRLFLDVGGSLTVEPGGTIDASYRGYAQDQGPSRGDHGGRGQGGDGVPYGSITAPVSLGSGGRAYSQSRAGGGAVKLNVAGNTVINGTVRVVGQPPGSGYSFGGAGGSVFLTSGTLAGNGTVDASGANGTTGHDATGGGGRIAVILTNGMDIGNVRLMAYGGKASGGGYGVHSAAGTVYVRLQDQSRGKMMVANNNLTSDYQTLVTSNVTAVVVGDVEIRDAAWFQIMADQTLTVYGSWSNAATFSSLSGSTVEFTGPAPVSVWGDTTWDNLTIATSGKTVSFEADKTQTVNGTPTFDNRVTLLSTEPGGQWKLTVPIDGENTTQPVGRVSARDSDASGGRTIIPQGGSDLDNNLNWIFPPPGLFLLLR